MADRSHMQNMSGRVKDVTDRVLTRDTPIASVQPLDDETGLPLYGPFHTLLATRYPNARTLGDCWDAEWAEKTPGLSKGLT